MPNPKTMFDEDAEIDALEAGMRAGSTGDALNPNSKTTETTVEVGAPETSGETQVIDGSGKEVKEPPVEEKEEVEAKQELEAEQAEPEPEKVKPKIRPWSELRRTKKEKDRLEAELAQERQRVTRIEEEFKAIKAKFSPATETKEPEVPEFTKDPLGNLHIREGMTEKQLGELRTELQAQRLKEAINEAEAAYTREKPDYVEARDYLLNRELERARTLFRALPEAQREQYAIASVNQRRMLLIATANEGKESVAKLAYDLAIADGYQPKSATNGNVEAAKADTAKEKVKLQAKREEQSRASLGATGKGAGSKGALTRDDILNLSEADMDKLAAQDENWDAGVVE
ncbi:MAG: hypothetical protein KGJ90_01835 [Patescibacteria group bacterium]|nr:hypothetical protein [Patescibacteria group bacterium]